MIYIFQKCFFFSINKQEVKLLPEEIDDKFHLANFASTFSHFHLTACKLALTPRLAHISNSDSQMCDLICISQIL